MARRVGNREGRGSGGDVTGIAHINKEKNFTEENCATCEELQREVQKLEEEKQELREKCSSKSEKIRDLEAHMTVVKGENKKFTQDLKQKEGDIKRLKFTPSNLGEMWSELNQKRTEIADYKKRCKDNELEIQTLKQQLTRVLDEPCTRPDCGKMRSDKAASELELSQLKSEACTKIKCREILSEHTELTTQCSKLNVELTKRQQEVATLTERYDELVGRQQEQEKLRAELQQKTEALDKRRNQQESLELENEELTKKVERLKTELEQTMKVSNECRSQQERLRAELKAEALDEYKQLQERLESEKKEEFERLQSDFEQRKMKIEKDYRSERQRIQSELKHKEEQQKKLQSKVQQVVKNKNEQVERMQLEKDELAREIESLKTLTCKGKECPSQHLQVLRSDILNAIGIAESSPTGERVSLRSLITAGQKSLHEQLQQLQQPQEHQGKCAACFEKEDRLQRLKQAHHLLQAQSQEIIKNHEKTLQDLKAQLYSGQCQRSECVKVRKEQRQAAIKQMGDPGKDMDKQRLVEHDQLIHEFERLTTDTDGLLGVLEETLQEYGDDANFEAKRLLCALFQESYDSCKKAVIHAVSAQLQMLFGVQPKKTEEMEDASRGYGLLLSAFGLRTKEMRANNYTEIKTMMYSKISSEETRQKVKETLESSDDDHLEKVIALAWKFVTLPNPLIVHQPESFDSQLHEPEYGRWEKPKKELPLIYTRPVVYRNYEGMVARKGWVANTATSQPELRSKCLLS